LLMLRKVITECLIVLNQTQGLVVPGYELEYKQLPLNSFFCSCRTASLAELYDFPEKLVACMRSTVQGPAEGALFSSAWLYVLSCFQYRQGDSVREQPSSMAVRLGDDYMKGVADKVKTLLLRISEVELLSHNKDVLLGVLLGLGAGFPRGSLSRRCCYWVDSVDHIGQHNSCTDQQCIMLYIS